MIAICEYLCVTSNWLRTAWLPRIDKLSYSDMVHRGHGLYMFVCVCSSAEAEAAPPPDFGLGRLRATVRYSAQRNKLVLVVSNCVWVSRPGHMYLLLSLAACDLHVSHVPIVSSCVSVSRHNYFRSYLNHHHLPSDCRDLLPVEGDSDNSADPYLKIYILPERSKSSKRKSEVMKNNLNPVFDET